MLSRTLDNDDLLPGIGKPVLITHAENDEIVLRAAAEQHGAVIAQARTSFYPHVGHALFWEASERFNRELQAFAQAL